VVENHFWTDTASGTTQWINTKYKVHVGN